MPSLPRTSLLFLLGAVSLLGQVVLLRELAVAFYGVELSYILALGAWLLATAAGALLPCRAEADTLRACSRWLILAGLLVPVSVVFIRGSRILFGAVPGAYLPFDHQLAVLVLALAPVGLLSGWLFRRAAHQWAQAGGTLAGAYAIESAGGLAGGLMSALGLALGMQNAVLACVAAGLAWLSLASREPAGPSDARSRVVLPAPRIRRRAPRLVLAGLALALFLAAGLAFDRPTTRWAHPDLVDVHDSPYGRIAVVARGSQLVVFQNDALWFETESVEAEAFVHVAAVQHEAPGRVLVLGGGAAGLVEEVLKHEPSSVDWVEIDAAVARIVLPRLPAQRREAFADARVTATIADPRRFLREAGSYDLILAGAAEPTSGEANRFYTREFFAEAARHLSPGGVLAFRLASTEPYWSLPVARRARSIRDALASAFPDVLVLPGAPNVFLAANGRLVRAVAALAGRLEERGVSARLVSPAYLRYVYDPERVADLRARFEAVRAPINTDGRPVCYQYTAIIWLSQFYPRLATLGGPLDAEPLHRPLARALALAGLAALLLRRHAGLRPAAFVATAGFTGMVLETILLLHYQLKNGVVFQDIGLLLTAVMIGLAGGAFAVDRAARRAEGDRRLSVWWAVGIAVLAVGVALATAWTVHARPEIGLPWAAALLALTGAAVSMAFGYAGLRPGLDRGRLAGRLYAADLAGAAAGTLVATLVLIPLAGLAASAVWIAALALILLLLA